MQVTTKAVYDIETLELLEWEGYDHHGPIALCKSDTQKQQEQINLQQSRAQLAAQQQAMQQAQAYQQRQNDIFGQISPFANNALDIGQGALSGQIPQEFIDAFLQPGRISIDQAFSGARGNLFEALGRTGQLQSGLSSGPLRSFEIGQANAYANSDTQARLNALMQAMQLGTTGANILQGQQAVFNPAQQSQLGIQAGQAALYDPRTYARAGSGLLGSALGLGASAGLGALGGGPSNPLAGNSPYGGSLFTDIKDPWGWS